MSHLSKNRKKQQASELWSIMALLVNLAYLKESVENSFLVVSFTQKETSFSTKREVVKHNKTHVIDATISTLKYQNSIQLYIHWLNIVKGFNWAVLKFRVFMGTFRGCFNLADFELSVVQVATDNYRQKCWF